jgi:hypothetical protein
VRAQNHALQGCDAKDASVGTAAKKTGQLKSERVEKTQVKDIKNEYLHLGADLGPLCRMIRRALHGGWTLGSD